MRRHRAPEGFVQPFRQRELSCCVDRTTTSEEPDLPSACRTLPPNGTGARTAPAALAVLVAAVLLLLPGCADAVQHPEAAPPRPDHPSDPVGDRPVQPGGDLVMGLSAEPDALDPTTSSLAVHAVRHERDLREALRHRRATAKIVPQLAHGAADASRTDGRTVTIPLRTGIEFADGTTLRRGRGARPRCIAT